MAKPLVCAFHQFRACPFELEQDPRFSKQRRKAGDMRDLLFHGLKAAIADFDRSIGDTDRFFSLVLPRNQGDEVQITVGGQRPASSGAHQNHRQQIPAALPADVSKRGGKKVLLAGRHRDCRLLRRFGDV